MEQHIFKAADDWVYRVSFDGMRLEWVPHDHPDYYDIALAAVKQNGLALQFVPPSTARYLELAFIASHSRPEVLDVVFKDL